MYGRNRGRGRVALYLFEESRCQDARQVEDASEARIVVLVCFFPLLLFIQFLSGFHAYVPPPLLNNLLSLLRTKASSRKWDSFIYTAKTVTVSSLNKKAPYASVSEESIQQAQHQLDLFVFRRSFLELLLESLPDSAIVFNMEEAVMSVASAHHVNVVDVTPLCTVPIEGCDS